jgi:mono/diheme cytochrome c family protein
VLALAAIIGTLACSEANAPATTANPGTPAPAASQSSKPQAAAPGAPVAGEPANVADIFPPGAGRDVVLNSCGSCHNLACSAIGQRTADRWKSLRESHKDKVSDADANAAFAYLQSHFNDGNPEPRVPAKFLQGGCTPF